MSGYFLDAVAPALHARLEALLTKRLVFFAGLPATGKSLLVHQLAHLAVARGIEVSLLQWDVARPALEASAAGRAHPMVEGITTPVVRRAVGLWARDAVAAWREAHRDGDAILIGETPFVGGRLVELARPENDAAEAAFRRTDCVFVLATPSETVRAHIERERARRTVAPLHPREREDAPPAVLNDSWRELVGAAAMLGLTAPASRERYAAALYIGAYSRLLRYRNLEVIDLNVTLPTQSHSVYDYEVACTSLLPTAEEAARYIAAAEGELAATGTLRTVERWWDY